MPIRKYIITVLLALAALLDYVIMYAEELRISSTDSFTCYLSVRSLSSKNDPLSLLCDCNIRTVYIYIKRLKWAVGEILDLTSDSS